MPVIIAFIIAMDGFLIGRALMSKVSVEGISHKDIKIAVVECQRYLPRDQECGVKLVTFVKEKGSEE